MKIRANLAKTASIVTIGIVVFGASGAALAQTVTSGFSLTNQTSTNSSYTIQSGGRLDSGTTNGGQALTVASPTTTVTNAGTIAATGTSVAVRITGNSVSMTNSGTIAATGTAVRVTGTGVTITNSGTITSTGDTIAIATAAGTGASNTTTITNTGTISATGTSGSAISTGTGGAGSVGVVSITNSGTISITNAANSSNTIDLSGTSTGSTVTNSAGTISTAGSGAAILLGTNAATITLSGGTVSTATSTNSAINLGGAGTLNVTGSVTLSGGITGTGTTTIASGGILSTGTGASSYTPTGTFTVASGGTLSVGSTSSGSVTTTINNTGAVSVSGTLLINRSTTSAGGTLAFGGNVTGITFSSAKIVVGLPSSGGTGTYTGIITSTGTFLPTTTTNVALSSTNPAYNVTFAGSTSTTSMSLVVAQATAAEAAANINTASSPTVVAAVTSVTNSLPAGASSAINSLALVSASLISSSPATPQAIAVNLLYETNAAGSVVLKSGAAQTIAQLTPASSTGAGGGTASAAATGSVSASSGPVAARLDSVGSESRGNYASAGATSGMATASDASKSRAVWMQALATNANQDARLTDEGSKSTTRGLILGGDYTFNGGAILGAALSYGTTSVKPKGTNSGSDTDLKSYMGIVYGTYAFGNPFVEAQAGYGVLDFDTKRIVGTTTSKRSYDGSAAFGKLGLGYPVNFNTRTSVTPLLLTDVTRVATDGATESDGLRGTFGSTTNTSFRVGAGARFKTKFELEGGGSLLPELRAQYMYNTSDKGIDQSITGYSGATAYTAPGLKVARGETGLGGGLGFSLTNGLLLTGNYDLGLKEKYQSHTFSGKVRMPF